MTSLSSFSISIRRCYLMSSTIIGFARVVVDNKILLKEIPIFHNDDQVMVQLTTNQVAMYCDSANTYIKSSAACPADMDIDVINRLVWHFRGFIEMAIEEEWKKQHLNIMDN